MKDSYMYYLYDKVLTIIFFGFFGVSLGFIVESRLLIILSLMGLIVFLYATMCCKTTDFLNFLYLILGKGK